MARVHHHARAGSRGPCGRRRAARPGRTRPVLGRPRAGTGRRERPARQPSLPWPRQVLVLLPHQVRDVAQRHPQRGVEDQRGPAEPARLLPVQPGNDQSVGEAGRRLPPRTRPGRGPSRLPPAAPRSCEGVDQLGGRVPDPGDLGPHRYQSLSARPGRCPARPQAPARPPAAGQGPEAAHAMAADVARVPRASFGLAAPERGGRRPALRQGRARPRCRRTRAGRGPRLAGGPRRERHRRGVGGGRPHPGRHDREALPLRRRGPQGPHRADRGARAGPPGPRQGVPPGRAPGRAARVHGVRRRRVRPGPIAGAPARPAARHAVPAHGRRQDTGHRRGRDPLGEAGR
ncbi:hypothetical protein SGRIM128S_02750 [Streptomyces griseomycini]